MINYNKFNVYTTEIEKILNLALRQESNIHITTDTIFGKITVYAQISYEYENNFHIHMKMKLIFHVHVKMKLIFQI